MPLIGTRAVVSAGGYGFCSLGGGYWLSTLGGTTLGVKAGTAAVDINGNMFAVSSYSQSFVYYAVISKINSFGNLVWQVQFNPSAANTGFDSYEPTVSVDISGNIYCLGLTNNTSTGQDAWYFAKFNTFGALQWSQNLEIASGDNNYACINDASNNIIVAGTRFSGTYNPQIAKYNSSSTIQWQRQLATGSTLACVDVTADSSSNIYFIGSYVPSNRNIIVAKYNASGVIQWQRQLNDPVTKYLTPRSIVSDGTNIYGLCCSSPTVNSEIVYVFKYDASGSLLWQRQLQINDIFGHGQLAASASGDVYLCGGNSGLAYVAKYNTNGVLQWQRRIGVNAASTRTYGRGIAVDNKGGLLLQLMSSGTISVGSITARLPIDGTKTGTYALSTFNIDYISSSITEAAGALVSSTLTLVDSSTTLTTNSQTSASTASALSYTITQI